MPPWRKQTEDKQSSQSKSMQTSVCFVTITVFSNISSRKVLGSPRRLGTSFGDLHILVLKSLTSAVNSTEGLSQENI